MLLVWHIIGNIVTSSLHLSLPLAMIVVRFYTQTKKTVNTANISGMFIVF